MVLIILMFAICLIEVMDNPVKLLSIQGIYLMYLYLGSIAVIICIYIWVLIDSCVSLTADESEIVTSDSSSPGIFTLNRFNSLKQFSSLKRAHISRSKTSDTSFYLRIGALGKFIKTYCQINIKKHLFLSRFIKLYKCKYELPTYVIQIKITTI